MQQWLFPDGAGYVFLFCCELNSGMFLVAALYDFRNLHQMSSCCQLNLIKCRIKTFDFTLIWATHKLTIVTHGSKSISNKPDIISGYPLFGRHLNATNRPIIYSCR
jgi:hypothetical protein